MKAPLSLPEFRQAAEAATRSPRSVWSPIVARLEPSDVGPFHDFCARAGITTLDTLERQVAELAAVRLPSGSSEARGRFVREYFATRDGVGCAGLRVYPPWKSTVSHLLEPEAYLEVITNRNRDKITRREQELLRSKRVGVIGLSVGGEAAVAVAQEHLCGELRLADFDALDLSNLNRLNAGFDELGLNKAVIAARRVSCIDPYLKLTVVEQGVAKESLDDFLDGLDLLIEECDNLPIKYLVRRRARERRLNIVYAGDERGFLSVEPYAYHPDLEVFHGRVGPRQPERGDFKDPALFLKSLTNWLGGWEEISNRSRQSLEQVGRGLLGYPQLAGEARFAAGQIAHVARRLLLGERLSPFLGWFDLSQTLPGA